MYMHTHTHTHICERESGTHENGQAYQSLNPRWGFLHFTSL